MPRRAGAGDVAAVAGLSCELWPDNDPQQMVAEFAALLTDEACAIFLHEEEGRAVAFAQAQLRYDYVEGTDSSPVGYLEAIYVRAPFRGQGIAAGLLAGCEGWARERGCREFASDCELHNAGSLAFHLAAGFEEANRIICFTKQL